MFLDVDKMAVEILDEVLEECVMACVRGGAEGVMGMLDELLSLR